MSPGTTGFTCGNDAGLKERRYKVKRKGKPNPRRAELRKLSEAIRPLVKAGQFDCVNDGLRAHWTDEAGRSDWNTFRGWQEHNKKVCKGASGFPVWAAPRACNKAAEGAQPGEITLNDDKQWFPVCYLFHGGQVEDIVTELEKVAA